MFGTEKQGERVGGFGLSMYAVQEGVPLEGREMSEQTTEQAKPRYERPHAQQLGTSAAEGWEPLATCSPGSGNKTCGAGCASGGGAGK